MDIAELLRLQLELQRSLEVDPLDMTVAQRVEYFRWNVLALEDELHEALQETSWKPWATGEAYIHSDRCISELVDCVHFLCNLLLAAAPDGLMSVDELARVVADRYRSKNRRNHQRRVEGYDGISDKCPHCGRDTVDLTPREHDGSLYCSACGARLEITS